MIDIASNTDPRTTKLIESGQADADRLDGLLEYVAMMADVDLHEEGDGDE